MQREFLNGRAEDAAEEQLAKLRICLSYSKDSPIILLQNIATASLRQEKNAAALLYAAAAMQVGQEGLNKAPAKACVRAAKAAFAPGNTSEATWALSLVHRCLIILLQVPV